MTKAGDKKVVELTVEFSNMKENFIEMKTELRALSAVPSQITNLVKLLENHISHEENTMDNIEKRIAIIEKNESWMLAKISTIISVGAALLLFIGNKLF